VLFPETEPEPAHELLQRINVRLVDALNGHGANVTLSIGAATFRGFPACVDDVIKQADTLMYEAKRGGRNRVEQGVFDG
jgi:diguanylate cyclase (GGDEF)-like protein